MNAVKSILLPLITLALAGTGVRAADYNGVWSNPGGHTVTIWAPTADSRQLTGTNLGFLLLNFTPTGDFKSNSLILMAPGLPDPKLPAGTPKPERVDHVSLVQRGKYYVSVVCLNNSYFQYLDVSTETGDKILFNLQVTPENGNKPRGLFMVGKGNPAYADKVVRLDLASPGTSSSSLKTLDILFDDRGVE